VAWDLRAPAPAAVTGEVDEDDRPSGVLQPPGTYTVELSRRVDGREEALAGPVAFAVRRLREPALPGMTPEAYAAAMEEVAEVQRRVSGAGQVFEAAMARLNAIQAALDLGAVGDPSLYADAVALEKRLEAVRDQMWGHSLRSRMQEPGPVPVSERLSVITGNLRQNTYGPTAMHREQFELAKTQFAAARTELEAVAQTELPRLEARLEAAGVPWTPGRPVPGGE
jgi:hypothetical protein